MKQQKIVLISSGQPSLNPRLVKEADALADAGFDVTVLYAYWNNWGDEFNKKLFPTKKWKAVCAGGHPTEQPVTYFLSRLIHKSAKLFSPEFAVARAAFFLLREAKKHPADLYVGHNLGALPAVVKAAKKHNAKSGFDIEDFHRFEINDDFNSSHYKTVKHLEDKYYQELDYATVSSPQIADAYSKLYPKLKPVIVLNVFPKSDQPIMPVLNANGPLKLFWFSQTIGSNRGLDKIAKALKLLRPTDFELHLLGYIDNINKQQFVDEVLAGLTNVHFHAPIPSDELDKFASQFDIGLALEPGFSTNNKLALSNKLFTYLQAGLAIIASDTLAQRSFVEDYPAVGQVFYNKDIELLAGILATWQADRAALLNIRQASLKLGRDKLNWENESIKFLSMVNETLKIE